MKKIILFFSFIFIVAYLSLNNSFINQILLNVKSGEVNFYCSQDNQIDGQIKNGSGYICECEIENFNNMFNSLKGCYGFSIETKMDEEEFENFLKKIKIIKTQKLDENIVVYGYASNLCFSNYISNKKVNIEIAKNNERVVIGCPVILGSF